VIKAIFFDFDGVLVESMNIKTEAFIQLFSVYGSDVIRKVTSYHLQNGGVSRYDKFRYIYREILCLPLGDEEFASLCRRFSALVTNKVVEAPYVDGALEFLENYYTQYFCVVTSATPQFEIEEIIQRRGMDRFFRVIYGSPTNKSDAVREVLALNKLEPESVVYVGDAMCDYHAARSNDVKFIARISDDGEIFSGVDSAKINDLNSLVNYL
jgi:HAD superfamily hydrolase (TIGR01549 family)